MRNLLTEYLVRMDRTSPVSIAVFGPPGCGKSYGVKQIATHLRGADQITEFVFNLAQFESFDQLTEQLLKVRDAGLENKIPLVFLDEFDCSLEEQTLGWLKYFLAPMQDGRFQHGDSMLGIGRAILVFAGGIANSHSDFVSSSFWASVSSEESDNVFRAAKGPDFHSRLRGYMDIRGVNPILMSKRLKSTMPEELANGEFVDDFNDNEDFSYIVRRAVVIRQLLEIRARSEPQLLDLKGRVDVDQDVLDAMLTTMRYEHGVRSIESIIDMSLLAGHRQFSKSALPAASQFSMHVDPTFRKTLLRQYNALHPVLKLALSSN